MIKYYNKTILYITIYESEEKSKFGEVIYNHI